jgi:hypothetical protein
VLLRLGSILLAMVVLKTKLLGNGLVRILNGSTRNILLQGHY